MLEADKLSQGKTNLTQGTDNLVQSAPVLMRGWLKWRERQHNVCLGVAGGLQATPEPNVVEISRHTGMDRRYPDCKDAPKPDHPWSLGSGGPCRNDGENLIQQH